jgi:hypothetical protein
MASSVRCPHCKSGLAVAAILKNVPIAELCDDASTAELAVADDGGELALEPIETRPRSEPSRSLRDKSGSQSSQTRPRGLTRPAARTRTGRREDPFFLLKIVLGGLLAIPVAQLILWWVFGRDPLDLARPVHDFAPFLVPESLAPPREPWAGNFQEGGTAPWLAERGLPDPRADFLTSPPIQMDADL